MIQAHQLSHIVRFLDRYFDWTLIFMRIKNTTKQNQIKANNTDKKQLIDILLSLFYIIFPFFVCVEVRRKPFYASH